MGLTTEPIGNDYAAGDKNALTLRELCGYLDEIRQQPNWRRIADREADYYDGNQLDSDTLRAMEDLGMAPIIENLTAPIIDTVLGLEVRTRLDWRVTAAKEAQFKDVAEAINVKLNEAERESHADRANSDAYAAQAKVGLGWVEVSREHDPFKYPYRCGYVHRNEIWWDWRAKDPLLRDGRYLVRRRWHDEDVVLLAWPHLRDLITHAVGAWADFDPVMMGEGATGLAMAQDQERQFILDESDWRDTGRRRVCLYEIWYRRWVRGHVIKVPGGGVFEYEPNNPRHVQAVAVGAVRPQEAVFTKMRQAWYLGPHRMSDGPSPYRHSFFPYVPFFGKREDLTGVPYGLMRSMMTIQDEINARNTKLVWLLAAKRVTATEGVVKDKETARREIARPDAWVELDKSAPANARFEVESDFGLSAQQYQALVDKREGLKNVAGVYQAMMGGRDSPSQSGVALATQVEQGTQTLAEINDNYRYARTMVGELLMHLVIEDIGNSMQEVLVERTGAAPRTVRLNDPATDGEVQYLNNDVQRARLKVALSDVPSTPSYRAQRLTLLTEITKSLPPEVQMLVIDFVMAATDLPERDLVVERLRTRLQLDVPGAEKDGTGLPQTEQEFQQAVAAAVQEALVAAGIDLQRRAVEVNEFDAETRRLAVEQAGESKVLELATRAGA